MSDTRAASLVPLSSRSVVMVTSPGQESTLADVAINLATVCAEVGQEVVMVSTATFAAPAESDEGAPSPPLWWLNWPSPQSGSTSVEEQRRRLQSEDVSAADIGALLGETGVEGVRRLDLRYFVKHPAQVVVRGPQVVSVLRQMFDVVILEVPAYLTVHHGEGLTPIADAVLVVGERNSTTMDDMRKTRAALTRLVAPVVGVVLTGAAHSQDVWGAEFEGDSIHESFDDGEMHDADSEVGLQDTAPAPVVHALDNRPAENGASENGASGNGASENGVSENGVSEHEAPEHEAVDAVLARRDSPEA